MTKKNRIISNSFSISLFSGWRGYSLHRAVDYAREAIAHAKKTRVGKLLMVTTGLTGFDSPSLVAR